jgi:hypothetical protein
MKATHDEFISVMSEMAEEIRSKNTGDLSDFVESLTPIKPFRRMIDKTIAQIEEDDNDDPVFRRSIMTSVFVTGYRLGRLHATKENDGFLPGEKPAHSYTLGPIEALGALFIVGLAASELFRMILFLFHFIF